MRFRVDMTIDGVTVPSSTVKSNLSHNQAEIVAKRLNRNCHPSIVWIIVESV
jgi:hypothetical protein